MLLAYGLSEVLKLMTATSATRGNLLVFSLLKELSEYFIDKLLSPAHFFRLLGIPTPSYILDRR